MALFTAGATAAAGTAAAGTAAAAAGTAAAGTAAAAATGAAALGGTAASAFSLSSLLSGGATLLSMVSSISAGNAEAEKLRLEADDAAREVPLETLQGINRRTSLKREAAARVGELDVAYAGSGTDLSFGTPVQARQDAWRDLDTALTSDIGTQQTRVARLEERQKNYLRMAGRAKKAGMFEAITTGLSAGAKMAGRY